MEALLNQSPETLHRHFEGMADTRPDATAIICPVGAITYRELERQANQLAHHLISLGAGPEKPVAIQIERSIDYAIAVLGVLKAGSAFVPIDVEWPQERIDFVLSDSGSQIRITAGHSPTACAAPCATVDLRKHAPHLAGLSALRPIGPGLTPDNLAYIIYTSGSTGKPKGVLIEHGAVATHISSIARVYQLGPDDRSLFFHSVAFDPAIEQLFAPLATGGTIILRDAKLWNGADFARFVSDNQLSVATLPAAYWLQLVREWETIDPREQLASLRQVIVGGEALPPAAVALWRKLNLTRIRLLNDYGPTECTITATVHVLPAAASDAESCGRIPIGRPHEPVALHLIRDDGHHAEPGDTGEICLAGPTLARGYLGHRELTHERFTSHPGIPGTRIYRTGDLARYHQDGTLDFLGRVDDQVKVRGFRVELGEVETCLSRQAGVAHAAVVVVDKGEGDRHLAAFIIPTPGAAPDGSRLRANLSASLPEAAIPAEYHLRESFPTTPNGKVDRKQLVASRPGPSSSGRPSSPAASGEPPIQALVAEAWETFLGQPGLDRQANVFEHGATSLSVVRVHHWLEARLARSFSVTLLFQHTSIDALANALSPREAPAMTAAISRARAQRAVLARRRQKANPR